MNRVLYHRLKFSVGDPVALIESEEGSTLIVRDIEMERAKRHARVDQVFCPADFAPKEGLSGDREIATGQALALFLKRKGHEQVESDRTLPFSFANEILSRGIGLKFNLDLGVKERRAKSEEELDWLRKAQTITTGIVERACRLIARASADAEGILNYAGMTVTSERMRSQIDRWLLEEGYRNSESIVAGGPQAADCHHLGSGPLHTGQPILVDIFPCDKQSGYNGDCTRTVVHGEISDEVAAMHRAVQDAHSAATHAVAVGVTGEAVHQAAIDVIREAGYRAERPDGTSVGDVPTMTHGTGHGIGLEVHEPPLLDFSGPELVAGDVLTIEPGLYSPAIGGVRIEDLVFVTETGCESITCDLPTGLDWR